MVSGISNINNIGQIGFQPQAYQRQTSKVDELEPLTSFDDEDQAIISSQAMLLNELDKFNSGTGDAVNLAIASVMAKFTVQAEVNVIKAKEDMFDAILNMAQ